MRDKVWRNIVQVDEFPEVGVSIQCTFLESLGDGWHGRAERSAPQQLRRGERKLCEGDAAGIQGERAGRMLSLYCRKRVRV